MLSLHICKIEVCSGSLVSMFSGLNYRVLFNDIISLPLTDL